MQGLFFYMNTHNVDKHNHKANHWAGSGSTIGQKLNKSQHGTGFESKSFRFHLPTTLWNSMRWQLFCKFVILDLEFPAMDMLQQVYFRFLLTL